jgi:hypothetical protein
LFHDSDNLQRKLQPVLEGAGWFQWTKRYKHPEKPKRAYDKPVATSAATVLREVLDGLPSTTEQISFKELKLRAGLTGLDSGVFNGAVTMGLKETRDGWIKLTGRRRGLIRANVLFSKAG